jgi:hypothetical protein
MTPRPPTTLRHLWTRMGFTPHELAARVGVA